LIKDPESNFSYKPAGPEFLLLDIPKGYRRKKNHYHFNGATSQLFCMFCGAAVPIDFSSQWERACKEELGKPNKKYTNWSHASLFIKLPQKFTTEQWWRERNLSLKYHKPLSIQKWCQQQLKKATSDESRNYWLQQIDKEIMSHKNLNGICCTKLKTEMFQIFDCKTNSEYSCSKFPLIYESEKRRFFLPNIASFFNFHGFPIKPNRKLLNQIFYCPWCGKVLPKSLANEWFRIVTTEFGVSDIYNHKQLAAKVPQKFLSEDWWRERGL
jgi:hypothetical protein